MGSLFDSDLRSCIVLVANEDGNIECPMDEIKGQSPRSLAICGRVVTTSDGAEKLREFLLSGINENVVSLDIAGSILSDNIISHFLSNTIGHMKNLLELNLSYISLGRKTVNALCSIIDTKISGYSSIRRILLARTK